jgi:hypothetical protein
MPFGMVARLQPNKLQQLPLKEMKETIVGPLQIFLLQGHLKVVALMMNQQCRMYQINKTLKTQLGLETLLLRCQKNQL